MPQMKLETLAKRIATKSNCPELGQYILTGEVPKTVACIPWTGAVRPKAPRMQLVRHQNGEIYPTLRWPRPVIGYNGQRKGVMRTMFEIVHNLDSELGFRMHQICEDPLCVNPAHWEARTAGGYTTAQDVPEILESGDHPWTPEEVEEMLEICLESNPTSWEQIIRNEMMEGAPAEIVRDLLIRFNKEHLTK